jgi:hypothetical protein
MLGKEEEEENRCQGLELDLRSQQASSSRLGRETNWNLVIDQDYGT